MDQLKRDLAEMTIRMLALPSNSSGDHVALAEVERMANQVLREVAMLKSREAAAMHERCGVWRVFKTGS
jgi:hypothetical protein